ncbi:MAG: glycosyltransferase [Clostridia bacterium]|nr:glycosyltransferase [Clostridia bacterium]
MPRLSVVLPVYNVAPFLPQCLDSLLNQSYEDLEILAVDDGSTDESLSILREYEEKAQGKLKVFTKENGGLSDARNFGMERATGTYLAFIDSDDFVHPDFCRKMVEKMEEENLDLVICDFYYYFSPDHILPSSAGKGFCEDRKKEAILSAPMAWLRLCRREKFSHMRFEKGIYYEDLLFASPQILEAEKIGFVKEPLYYYRQREGSIMKTRAFRPAFLDIFTVLEKITHHFKEKGVFPLYEKELEFLYIEHLFRSAALRFAPLPQRKELFGKLKTAVEKEFPGWKKNPYLPRVSLFFRLTVFLAAKGHFRLVAILSRLKG